MALIDNSVRDLLYAFSSTDPTPGGGSASALASAVGASLLIMVSGLAKTRSNMREDREALDHARAELLILRQELTDAVDADTAAYDQVVSAYRLPKTSPEEQQTRRTAVQHALRSAIDVPLGVMRASTLAMRQAGVVAAHGYRSAASDVGVAVALLNAGATGARLNVEINLQGVSDAAYAEGLRNELSSLATELTAASAAAERELAQS